MQSNFQFAGEEIGVVVPGNSVDEAYLKGWYAGMNFAQLNGGVGAYHPFSPTPVENVALVPYENLCGFSPENLRYQDALSYTEAFELQKFSRDGNTSAVNEAFYPSAGVSLVDFFSTFQNYSLRETNDFGKRFDSVLPLLESFDQQNLSKSQPQTPMTMLSSINFPRSSSSGKSQSNRVKTISKRPSPYSSSSTKKTSRRNLGDKTRDLQNLLPGNKKMDIATILQEAYKYIKFLQAQVIALNSMPVYGGAMADDVKNVNDGGLEIVYGKLGKLNRQQLLQLVANSPMTQTILYTRGCCIYSVEQLNYLREVADKKISNS